MTDLETTTKSVASDFIVTTLKEYYETPPDKRIVKYLLLNFMELDELKKKYPLSVDVKNNENLSGGKSSVELGYIYDGFGADTKRTYIVRLACDDEYSNFYTEEDKQKLTEYIGKENVDMMDAVCRVDILRGIVKKNNEFPLTDLVYSLGIFAEDTLPNYKIKGLRMPAIMMNNNVSAQLTQGGKRR
jgi:hypothetical protein